MNAAHVAVGSSAILLNAAAAALGAWLYRRVTSSPWFWRILRGAQAATVLAAALGGGTLLIQHRSAGLHTLYGVLPLLVSVLAEQFRGASATIVLAGRGLEGAGEVGKLPEAEQRVIALTIMQREQGVMALAALVSMGLLIRAATTA